MREMLYIRQLSVGDIFIDELGERWMLIENRGQKFVLSMESAIFNNIEDIFSENEIVEKVSNTH